MLHLVGKIIRWHLGHIVVVCLLATFAHADEAPAELRDAVARLEQQASRAPAALGVEFRVGAAQALYGAWPELSRELAFRSIAQLRTGMNWRLTPDVMRALAIFDPDGAISVLPRMQANYAEAVINGLAQLHRIDDARSVYRAALARGARVTSALSLFAQLLNEKSPQITGVYRDMLSGFSFDRLDPTDAFWIDGQLTKSVAEIDQAAAVEGTIHMLDAAANPGYIAAEIVTAEFQIGAATVTTTNSRDTVLLLAGARLFALAPAEFEKRKSLFARWGATGPIMVRSHSTTFSRKAKTVFTTGRIPAQIATIASRTRQLDEQPEFDDSLVVSLAAELRASRAGWGKLDAARRLCEIAQDRHAGKPALTAAAAALLFAIRDTHPLLDPGQVATSFGGDYVRLAELARYGNVQLPPGDPAINAAGALLVLRERIIERIGFPVTDSNGKPQTISPLSGKISLVSLVSNSCARWKLRCDRPLPPLEAVYEQYGNKSIAVFAIVVEDREIFTDSLQGETFTVPLFFNAIDSFRSMFSASGLHETFVFDSRGRLVVRSIGVPTQERLRELLRKAGAE